MMIFVVARIVWRAYGDELTVPLAACRAFLFINTSGKP